MVGEDIAKEVGMGGTIVYIAFAFGIHRRIIILSAQRWSLHHVDRGRG